MDPANPAILSRHIPALDAIRGIAILAVTAYRFREIPVTEPTAKLLRGVLDRGLLGVDLFFVLSGFLITGILVDSKHRTNALRTFYIRRTLRIFPLYYLALILGLVVLPRLLQPGTFALADPPRESWVLWFYGANLLQSWTNAWPLGQFNHFWSLAVEEHFYLVWPWLIYLSDRRQAMRACVACIGFGLLSKLTAVGIYESPVAAEVLTLCRLDALGVGGWLALAAREPGGLTLVATYWRWVTSGALVLLVGVLGASRLLAGAYPLEAKMLSAANSTLFAVLCGALLIASITTRPLGLIGRIGNSRLLHRAGKYSYGWYVFQGLIAPDVNRYLTADVLLPLGFGSESLAIVVKVFLGGSLSLLVAILSWHWFEAPILNLRNTQLVVAPRNADSLAAEERGKQLA